MMIGTTLGDMDETRLKKVEGSVNNEKESTTWVEYYFEDALVHRSVKVNLKQPLLFTGLTSSF